MAIIWEMVELKSGQGMQIKVTVRYHLVSTILEKSVTSVTPIADRSREIVLFVYFQKQANSPTWPQYNHPIHETSIDILLLFKFPSYLRLHSSFTNYPNNVL